MKKFIPAEKLSKKAQQELNRKNRGSWNGVNPITRKTEDKKKYNRKRVQQREEDFSGVDPFSFLFQFPFLSALVSALLPTLLPART